MTSALLQRPALILNRDWLPIQVASAARALTLLYSGAARAVDPRDYRTFDWADWSRLRPQADEDAIETARLRLRLPEIVALVAYAGRPTGRVPFNRRNLFKRDRHACQYCGLRTGGDRLSIDHVTPRSQGGSTTWENCVLACLDCNRRKGARTPAEAGMRLKRPPQRPAWHPLFAAEPVRIASWSKLVSEAYWNVELES